VTGQTKSGSQAHHEQKNIKDRYVARIGVTGAPPWSQAWGWGSQASAWWPGLCPQGPSRAQPEMATWARLPVGSPPAGRSMRGLGAMWVSGRRAGVGLLYSSPAQPPCVGVHSGERRGSLPCAFGLGIGLLLLFVPTGRTAVQSTRPSWSPWEGYLIVLRLGTPLFYWGTSTLTWATTVIPGGRDREERPPRSEPERCSVIGLLC
ncbi:hypothetical protein L3Q82_015045, partial [Scortum barcoo]